MNCVKPSILTGSMLPIAFSVAAIEYVPPPAGPYQSSVVIQKESTQTGNLTEKVYRFPSDIKVNGLKSYPTPSPAANPAKKIEKLPQTQWTTEADLTSSTADSASLPMPRQSTYSRQPANNTGGVNPWSVDYPGLVSPGQQNRNVYPSFNYQGYWSQPQYSQPQYYPYGYNQQNNFMNSPFGKMPSPWSGMSMQPFFSGSK